MIVLSLSEFRNLAGKIASLLEAEHVVFEYKLFPDGESYIRLPVEKVNVEGQDIVLVQSLYPQQDKRLVELFFMLDLVKRLGASRVIVVAPYLAYSRQDKEFRPGENISILTVLKILEKLGTDIFLTVDIHKEDVLKEVSMKALNVCIYEEVASFLRGKVLPSETVILGPDKGALGRAKSVASLLGCEYDYLEKSRDRITGEIAVKPKELNVADRNVVIVDDIISTGGTIALAAKSVKELGAKRVIAICTHGLFVRNAVERMISSGVDEIVTSDSILTPYTKISVAKPVAQIIKQL